jgi:hypothetical protein
MSTMRLEDEQKRLLYGLAAGATVGTLVALGLRHWFGANLLSIFPVLIVSLISTLWTRGGRSLWNGLSGLWQGSLIILAAAAIFTSVAVAERRHPDSPLLALMVTAMAAMLLLLYILFSRAMDALWSRFQQRRSR